MAGKPKTPGYVDKTGAGSRMDTPEQGVFVKNKAYEAAGLDDVYDFYFCDCNNHCIRKLTPDGKVSTYAGRGSTGMNTWAYGYIDGELRKEARFKNPVALAYDEETETFYVGDRGNHRIRKIALEGDDEVPEESEENPDESPEEGA